MDLLMRSGVRGTGSAACGLTAAPESMELAFAGAGWRLSAAAAAADSTAAGADGASVRCAQTASDRYTGRVSGNGRNRQAIPTASTRDAANPSAIGQRRGKRVGMAVLATVAACAAARMRASSVGDGSPNGPTRARRCASSRSSGVSDGGSGRVMRVGSETLHRERSGNRVRSLSIA